MELLWKKKQFYVLFAVQQLLLMLTMSGIWLHIVALHVDNISLRVLHKNAISLIEYILEFYAKYELLFVRMSFKEEKD